MIHCCTLPARTFSMYYVWVYWPHYDFLHRNRTFLTRTHTLQYAPEAIPYFRILLPSATFLVQPRPGALSIIIIALLCKNSIHTHLHGSPYMDRPRPFPRAHKREASGGFSGTINSPQSNIERMREGPEWIVIYSPKRNRVSVYSNLYHCITHSNT